MFWKIVDLVFRYDKEIMELFRRMAIVIVTIAFFGWLVCAFG